LKNCFDKLKPGGVFVLKEIGTRPRWKFERLRVQEFLSTRVFRITTGETMHFESEDELRKRLTTAGFEEVLLHRLDSGYTSPHLMLTGRRPLR
jgi:cyclopropane fatty-acyl-phospholipid synthase-like methyltransferase